MNHILMTLGNIAGIYILITFLLVFFLCRLFKTSKPIEETDILNEKEGKVVFFKQPEYDENSYS